MVTLRAAQAIHLFRMILILLFLSVSGNKTSKSKTFENEASAADAEMSLEVIGDCKKRGSNCISTSGYPFSYGRGQTCTIRAPPGSIISVERFKTAANSSDEIQDTLTVDYSFPYTNRGEGLDRSSTVTGHISWTASNSSRNHITFFTGWLICFSSVSVTNGSCTVDAIDPLCINSVYESDAAPAHGGCSIAATPGTFISVEGGKDLRNATTFERTFAVDGKVIRDRASLDGKKAVSGVVEWGGRSESGVNTDWRLCFRPHREQWALWEIILLTAASSVCIICTCIKRTLLSDQRKESARLKKIAEKIPEPVDAGTADKLDFDALAYHDPDVRTRRGADDFERLMAGGLRGLERKAGYLSNHCRCVGGVAVAAFVLGWFGVTLMVTVETPNPYNPTDYGPYLSGSCAFSRGQQKEYFATETHISCNDPICNEKRLCFVCGPNPDYYKEDVCHEQIVKCACPADVASANLYEGQLYVTLPGNARTTTLTLGTADLNWAHISWASLPNVQLSVAKPLLFNGDVSSLKFTSSVKGKVAVVNPKSQEGSTYGALARRAQDLGAVALLMVSSDVARSLPAGNLSSSWVGDDDNPLDWNLIYNQPACATPELCIDAKSVTIPVYMLERTAGMALVNASQTDPTLRISLERRQIQDGKQVGAWPAQYYFAIIFATVGFSAFVAIICLCCRNEKLYCSRGPKSWDPFIEPYYGSDVKGEASDNWWNNKTSGNVDNFCCCTACTGLCQCWHTNADTHPTRTELWRAAEDNTISDDEAVQVAEHVLWRSKTHDVLSYAATSYVDNRCGDCATRSKYCGALGLFAVDCIGKCMCCTCASAFFDKHCSSCYDWRHPHKLEYSATALQLACMRDKPKLAAVLFGAGATIWERNMSDTKGGFAHLIAEKGDRLLFKIIADRVVAQNQEFGYSAAKFLSTDEKVPSQEITVQLQPFQHDTRASLKYGKLSNTELKKTFIHISEHASDAERQQVEINVEKSISPRPAYKTYVDGETGATWLMFHGISGWQPLAASRSISGASDTDDAPLGSAKWSDDDPLLGSGDREDDDLLDYKLIPATTTVQRAELVDFVGLPDDIGVQNTSAQTIDANSANFRKIHWLDFRDGRGRTPIEVAKQYGHLQLVSDMTFIKEPLLTAELVRDASKGPIFIATSDFGSNAIKHHVEDYGCGLLNIASRSVCQNVQRASKDLDAVDKLARHVCEQMSTVLADADARGAAVLPMPVRLRPVKQLLQDYVQVPLYYHTCICIEPTKCDCVKEIPSIFRECIFNPLATVIRARCAELVERVRNDPKYFIQYVAEKAIPDAQSYDGMRKKALWGAGQQQYDTMLEVVHQIHTDYMASARAVDMVQPTGDPLQLIVLLRDATESFKGTVDAVRNALNGTLTERDREVFVAFTHRPMCKGLYRLIEKCLLKGGAGGSGDVQKDTLNAAIDCSKVKDAAGCLISCPTFEKMQEVIQALHAEKSWTICELKCTWQGLSKAGWRDYKVIVQFEGLLFEIQIALEIMMRSRNYLDGHVAYEEFRNIYECIKYVGGYDDELNRAVSPEVSFEHGHSVELSTAPSPAAAPSEPATLLAGMAQQLHALQGTASILEIDERMQDHIRALQAYVTGLQPPTPN